jgi:putative transposase
MKDQKKFPIRKSIRLKDFDYSRPGAYFVTICTLNKKCWFGKITNTEMILNPYGKIVDKIWNELAAHFIFIDLDYHIVMPNHIHGIIFINPQDPGLINQTPTTDQNQWIQMKNPTITLGKIIRYFKAKTTKMLHEEGLENFRWQRLYYDHIVRNNRSLDNIRYYIINNPLKWEIDKENPRHNKLNYCLEEV